MQTLKIITKLGLVAGALLAVLLFLWWADVCTKVAHVTFSKDRYCKLVFHEWNTGRSILSYSENGVCIGHVQLNNDLFNDPLAMFPGPDGKSVVCLSWPDTFDAAFTVDFSKRNEHGVKIPERLRLDGQEAVDFSNFEVRACTTKEIDFVRRYIETVDLKTFGESIRHRPSEDERQGMLTFLTWATSPNVWTDPTLKNAKPLLLPEDPQDAEASR